MSGTRSGDSMKSTRSAKPPSRSTRRTGGCSRRPPRATCSTISIGHRSSLASSTAASTRRRPVRRLVRARSSRGPSSSWFRDWIVPAQTPIGPRRGVTSSRSLRPSWAIGQRSESWRLQSLTSLDVLADYEENPYWSLERRAARRTRRARRIACLLSASPRAFKRPRTTASAGGGHSPRPSKPTPACSTPRDRTWPVSCSASSARRPWSAIELRPRPRQNRARSLRPLCPRHLEGRRDDRPAGFRNQAVQASRRIQSDQDLPGDRRRSQDRSRESSRSARWRRSSRTAASSIGPLDYLKRSRDALRRSKTTARSTSIDQILGAWGQFEPLGTLPAGRGATVDFRFRNGKQVHFEAHEILFTKLSSDVKDYISSAAQAARLAKDRHQRHRFPPGRHESAAVPGALGRPLGPRPRAAARPLRQADHRHHTASEGRRLPAHCADGGRKHQPHRGLARRHGDRQKTARRQVLLLRRRRADRPGRRRGRRRLLRLARQCRCRERTSIRVETKTLALKTDARRTAPGPDRRSRSTRRATTSG